MDVRDLEDPVWANLRQLRESRKGIQRLADAGYDVSSYIARLDAKRSRRDASRDNVARAVAEREARWAIADQKPFIAWDGEGWTDHDGEHRYNYFANSLGMYVEYPLLSSQECLELILTTGCQYPGAIHVIYGGGYDTTHIVRDMPLEHRAALREYGKVSWEGYTVEYIPHKWLTVRGSVQGQRVSVTIYDVMTFFQTSFIKALVSRAIEVPPEVVAGKANRDAFTLDDMPTIRQYTAHELRLLVELCEVLRAEFREAGMPVRKYYGPGAVADAVNRQYRIRSHMVPDNFNPEIELLCQRAYFGGRFEPFQIGHHDEPVFQADICSAYPDKIRQLPSLAGAHWEYRPNFTGELGIWRVTHNGAAASHLPHQVPWRAHDGAVGFPSTVVESWLWTYEAVHATGVGEGYALILESDDLPFAFMEGMYQTRRAWKAAGRGGHWALKLALNSAYGKMAQRVGGRDGHPPKYHQLAWAGMVTSMTRAQLWVAMQQNPGAVVAVETDSIMSTERLDLDYGNNLGQWELTEYDWVTYLQSGIYWTNAGQQQKIKTRGLDARELTHDQVIAFLASDQRIPLATSVRRFIALSNPDIANYGQWVTSARELSLSGGKRWHVPALCPACKDGVTLADALHRMVPSPDMGHGPSKPHPLPWRDDVPPNAPGIESAEDIRLDHDYEYTD